MCFSHLRTPTRVVFAEVLGPLTELKLAEAKAAMYALFPNLGNHSVRACT